MFKAFGLKLVATPELKPEGIKQGAEARDSLIMLHRVRPAVRFGDACSRICQRSALLESTTLTMGWGRNFLWKPVLILAPWASRPASIHLAKSPQIHASRE